ncbi:ras association domain-containing protein 8 [Cololabis saira]|uniref:ras association domain-containing protein 8 n=1 Tax=Cololabis saira TaxID=129043 RepID=UPI002AD3A0C7|nr:ras association domain-containing protein 8 [Cololabis saira]
MEVKVFVDGIPRVVCGVTEETTCQEVVLALAQARGQPGRYVLREKFKDFERCMVPDEHLLETLEKYGEQAKEVQLTLQHNAPPAQEETGKAKVGRYQPCSPLRRKDAGAKMRRGSGSLILHRQSLPPLSCLRQEAEQKQKDPKRPKRKSLTLMEEARDWLESLGKGKVYSTAGDKEGRKKTDKKNRHSSDLSFVLERDNSSRAAQDKDKSGSKAEVEFQTSCCVGSQGKDKEGKGTRRPYEAKSALSISGFAAAEDEKNALRETVIRQLLCLQDLHLQITQVDKQIQELEQKPRATGSNERVVDGEVEQVRFWENELKSEEGHERDLQAQFLEMRAKAGECKAKLEVYRRKMQGLEFFGGLNAVQDPPETPSKVGTSAAAETKEAGLREPGSDGDRSGSRNGSRKFPPKGDFSPPQALVPPNQTRERRLTGPTELREWWARWSETQNPESQSAAKAVHRSELTIYLRSTKV